VFIFVRKKRLHEHIATVPVNAEAKPSERDEGRISRKKRFVSFVIIANKFLKSN